MTNKLTFEEWKELNPDAVIITDEIKYNIEEHNGIHAVAEANREVDLAFQIQYQQYLLNN